MKKFVERSAHQLKDGVFFHQIIEVLVEIDAVVVDVVDVVAVIVIFLSLLTLLLLPL